MEIREAPQKPIPIHDYEFTFSNGRTLVITVFPTMGDTAVLNKTTKQWTFKFPRLSEEQTVYLSQNILCFLKREQMRVYVDPKEVVRRLNEERARQKAQADEEADKED